MKRCRISGSIAGFFVMLLPCLLLPDIAKSQIIPDNSLGTENSRILPDNINGLPSDRIEGGAIRGANLFHSFGQFNIPEGRGAYFANPAGVANIFTRVTGSNSSNILGTLGVLGNANLFLINPKGILFGPNARLDMRGSFVSSTADSFLFNNGFEYSSTNPQAPSLLAINIPLGLRFRENAGAIVNQSTVTQPIQGIETPVGLAVFPGQTLALVGGDINLTGNLTAVQGNILLGSVASPGLVTFGLTPTGLNLDYAGVQNFGNIELSGTASATTSGLGGGAIALRGANITLQNNANLVSNTLGTINGRDITLEATQLKILDRAFIATNTTGSGNAGNVSIIATESVEIKGSGFDNLLQTFLNPIVQGKPNFSVQQTGLNMGTVGAGNAGNISIDTKQLIMGEGAIINNPTVGTGTGGNITIKASESIYLNQSVIFAPTFNIGKGGNVNIDTGKLTLSNGSLLSTSTFGAGNGGDIMVRASDSIILSQSREDSPFGNSIGTNTIGNTGNAGNIELNTGYLLVETGAKINSASGYAASTGLITSAGKGGNITITADNVKVTSTNATDSTFRSLIVGGTTGDAQGGNVTINTKQLTVDGGSGIGANTLAGGNGGNVTVNASESILLTGTSSNNLFPSGLSTGSGEPLFQRLLGLKPPTGSAGNISVITPKLTITNGATINVGSLGTGAAGNINVIADVINLDSKGSIDGATLSGTGANINLQAQDILLKNNSRITTDAGSSDGGNINLNSEILLAFPRENSDITANARTAQGGRVTVNVPNIFGLTSISREQVRQSLGLTDAEFANLTVNPTTLLETSDIAAISQSAGPNLQGTVTFSTAGVNPVQGLVELPQNPVDAANLIAANPCRQGQGSQFNITGRGGLPASPNESLNSNSYHFTWLEPAQTTATNSTKNETTTNPINPSIMPAQSWKIEANGQVTLLANNPSNQINQRQWNNLGKCQPQ